MNRKTKNPQTRLFKPRRELGKTGFIVTQISIGDVADRKMPFEDCVGTVRRAIDAGLNLIDTAPGYENGYSEEIVGEAVSGRRNELFIVDKIDHHAEPVAPQIEESLHRLKMDHTDAFVFHGVNSPEGWKRLLEPGGGMDQLAECVKQGKARFKGISSHDPNVLREAVPSGLCDLVLFAIGPYCDPRFYEEILPLTRKHKVGTVCFKTFGAGKLLGDTSGYNVPLEVRPRGKYSSGGRSPDDVSPILPHLTVRECLHYTLTMDPDTALLGMSFPNEQDQAFQAALDYKALDPETLADIRERAAEAVQGKGPAWWNPKP